MINRGASALAKLEFVEESPVSKVHPHHPAMEGERIALRGQRFAAIEPEQSLFIEG